jgi:EmrB/QacA subfamily drug resistance transporter
MPKQTETGLVAERSAAHDRRWWLLVVLCLSLVIVTLDNTILNVALPTLVRTLHASADQLQWIVDGYIIVFAGLLLTAGSAGDMFGRKWGLMLGLGVFGVGSVLSALSATADQLIAARCLMGAGGAAIMPATLSILTIAFTDSRERAKAIGIWSSMSGIGIAIGPIAGGFLLDHFWWGSIFLVNVPIVAIGLVGAAALVSNSREPTSRPDWIGAGLSIVALSLLVRTIIEAPTDGWGSTTILGFFGIDAVLFLAFFLHERRCRHPMLRLGFFASPRFRISSFAVTLMFFSLFGMLFLLTQELQFVLGYSPLGAGLRTVPVAVMILLASPLAGTFGHRFDTRWLVGSGLIVVAGSLALMTGLRPSSPYGLELAVLVGTGLGMGLAMAPATDAIMGSIPPEQSGVASGTNGTLIQLGGALGVAVLGSALTTRFHSAVAPAIHQLPASAAAAANSGIGGALAVAHQLPPPYGRLLGSLARSGFANGIDLAAVIATGACLVGALVVLLRLSGRGGQSESTGV